MLNFERFFSLISRASDLFSNSTGGTGFIRVKHSQSVFQDFQGSVTDTTWTTVRGYDP